jgi:hypothetical protein
LCQSLLNLLDLIFSAGPTLNRLEDSLADRYGGGDKELEEILSGLPQVLLLHALFFQYNSSTEKMDIVSVPATYSPYKVLKLT